MSLQSYIYQNLASGLGFPPTSCQEALFSALSSFIVTEDESDIFLINGYAGTGKTSSIYSVVSILQKFEKKYILLAPTGRAAKVLAGYTKGKASTIHRQIYRQKSMKDGIGHFQLDINKNNYTIFIVDEASLISSNYNESTFFGSGNLLNDLIDYVRSNKGNKLIMIGDSAQLPPVGEVLSKALDIDYLRKYGKVEQATLSSVVRQTRDSGILYNATILRKMIEHGQAEYPKFRIRGFTDIHRVNGGELIESLSDSYNSAGMDETLVLCRSNRQANKYNAGIRAKLLYREELLNKGDKVMVVKNCYQFLENTEGLDFIANGDITELLRISGYEQKYGLNYAQATLQLPDYGEKQISAKIILDTLTSESANLGNEQSRNLFNAIFKDYEDIGNKRKIISAIREDKYFNALQIKYSNAVTVHKSQGGQWDTVYIDNPFWNNEMTLDDIKWLYTAVTRAVNHIYFINFDDRFFEN